MSDYTRKEFAAICRTTTAVVTTNINRGKVILFDKKIDSENKINKAFFNKYSKKAEEELKKKNKEKELSESIDSIYDQVVEKATTKVIKNKEDVLVEKRKKKEREKAEISVDWDLRKKKAEALLKERNAEKALLSVKKMYGEMVPSDFVYTMFSTFTKSLLSVFDNTLMNLAGVYCDELAGGDREALSRVNQKLNEEFQEIISAASEVAKKDLVNEIKQYSVKRGKGESE